MSDPEKLITVADIDNAAATDIVAADKGATTAAPAAETTADTASAPTEAPNGGEAPANQTPAEEPEWFKQRIKQITRQRRESERRADRLAAELESIKRTQAPRQPQSAELRPQDFPNYDAYVEAKIEAKTDEKIGALARSRSEQEAQGAVHNLREAFLEKATEQAEAADIDLEAVMETLGQAPLLSPTVLEHLAKSEQPARLAEWLAENPGELDRVSRLGPALAKKSLAKVEASFTDAKPKPNATKAPPPVPPVGGRAVTNVDPSKLNMDDYAAYWRKRQEAQSG
jgi:hypothetical protein